MRGKKHICSQSHLEMSHQQRRRCICLSSSVCLLWFLIWILVTPTFQQKNSELKKWPQDNASHLISSHAISSHLTSCNLISRNLILSHFISSHTTSSHAISSHLISCNLIVLYTDSKPWKKLVRFRVWYLADPSWKTPILVSWVELRSGSQNMTGLNRVRRGDRGGRGRGLAWRITCSRD